MSIYYIFSCVQYISHNYLLGQRNYYLHWSCYFAIQFWIKGNFPIHIGSKPLQHIYYELYSCHYENWTRVGSITIVPYNHPNYTQLTKGFEIAFLFVAVPFNVINGEKTKITYCLTFPLWYLMLMLRYIKLVYETFVFYFSFFSLLVMFKWSYTLNWCMWSSFVRQGNPFLQLFDC